MLPNLRAASQLKRCYEMLAKSIQWHVVIAYHDQVWFIYLYTWLNLLLKNFPAKEIPPPNDFNGEFYQINKKEITPVLKF